MRVFSRKWKKKKKLEEVVPRVMVLLSEPDRLSKSPTSRQISDEEATVLDVLERNLANPDSPLYLRRFK